MMMEIENMENADPNAMQKRKYMCEFQTNVAELIIRQLLEEELLNVPKRFLESTTEPAEIALLPKSEPVEILDQPKTEPAEIVSLSKPELEEIAEVTKMETAEVPALPKRETDENLDQPMEELAEIPALPKLGSDEILDQPMTELPEISALPNPEPTEIAEVTMKSAEIQALLKPGPDEILDQPMTELPEIPALPNSGSTEISALPKTGSVEIPAFLQPGSSEIQELPVTEQKQVEFPKLLAVDFINVINNACPLRFYVANKKDVPNSDQLIEKFKTIRSEIEVVPENEVVPEAQILVIMNTETNIAPRRSPKYVYAIACRHLIVNRTWMERCVAEKRLVNMNAYLIHGIANKEKSYASIRSFYDNRRPLKSYAFWFPAYFFALTDITPDFLKEVISCAGGEIKRDAVELTNFHDRKKAFILFPHNFPRQENDEEMADDYERSSSVYVIKTTWLFDALSEYKLPDPTNYRISKTPRKLFKSSRI
uniref:BRCT domain-containing protein n=1 Tax=Acrobeloides nanus TaxID=290746 RepID=A0A914DKJ7_9BILA